MTLWFLFAMMTAAAIFAVLWPLASAGKAASSGAQINVYRDQLAEVDRDRSAGLIAAPEAEAARVEVARRLIASADAPVPAARSPLWHRRAVAVVALVAVPVIAVPMYLAFGSPQLPGEPLAARIVKPDANASIDGLIAQVEAQLQKTPDDGRGWEVLAPVYLRIGRFDDAVRAWRNAITYNGESAERRASLGEFMTAAANGVVTAEAKDAFTRALALDAQDVKARYFLGLAAEQDGRVADAVTMWRALVKDAPADAPWVGFVHDALARVQLGTADANAPGPAAGQPGPNAQDVEAASNLNEGQRSEMVRGMVERLAAHMKTDGSDLDGWLRLVRSYVVLGDRDKARTAAADARRALASDPDKLKRIDELVKGLGLEG